MRTTTKSAALSLVIGVIITVFAKIGRAHV